jgi:hypothetical protein
MTQYLRQSDIENYGSDLADFSSRAAMDAVAPHLQHLQAQNDQLRQRLANEQRHRLDRDVETLVPDYREIEDNPAFHRYLLGIHPLTGQIRQQILNDAIAQGDAGRVKAFFDGFRSESHVSHSSADRGPARQQRGRVQTSGRIWSRDQVKAAYEAHRKGRLVGDAWARTESEIVAAGAEGRIRGGVDIFGK